MSGDGGTRTMGLEPEHFLARWCAARRHGEPGPSTLVIAAHPDDEVIGAGIRLGQVRDVTVLHVTDGSPRNGQDARAAGCDSREAYARLRRRELHAALRRPDLPPVRLRRFGVVDGEASSVLASLTRKLAAVFEAWAPEAVVTHPYEGGHPDHDATAFAVHHACALLRRVGRRPPILLEMTSYHASRGALRTGAFLPGGDAGVLVALQGGDDELKARMLESFASQRQTLAPFRVEAERFRLAPRYDFTRAPHAGAPYYEQFSWGPKVLQWRRLAAHASRRLGLGDTAVSRY